MFSGLYPIRMAVSEDDGHNWTPLKPIGDFGGVVTMASVERLKNGDYNPRRQEYRLPRHARGHTLRHVDCL